MPEEEALAWEFSTELHRNKSVSDATYAKIVERFGEQGAIDMAGVNGYYTFLAMTMNTARTPPPNGAEPALKPFPK
jgi:4-carboxymuconolactone decarboxylase